jgi:hypothetical protein
VPIFNFNSRSTKRDEQVTGTLHITSGDIAGGSLAKSGVPGDVFVWHDILYDGPRNPGWPNADTLAARARFLEQATAGGLDREHILGTLRGQYRKLTDAEGYDTVIDHMLQRTRQNGGGFLELFCRLDVSARK